MRVIKGWGELLTFDRSPLIILGGCVMRLSVARLTCAIPVLFAMVASVSLAGAAVPYPSLPKSDALNNLQKMRLGQLNVKDKPEYANAMVDMASWLADRLPHPPFNGEDLNVKMAGPPESIDTLLEEVERYCILPPRNNVDERNNQIDNYRVFAEKMAERLEFVMKDTNKRLVKVNAARMLAIIGKLPTDAPVNTYLKMIRDPAVPDEVKLYVFTGLGNSLAAIDFKDPTKGVIQDVDKLAEISKELDKFITTVHDFKVPPDHPYFAERAMVRQFIRREAIRAMAQIRFSVVRDRQRQPAARPIWTLLRVATRDNSIVPAFSESEQIEAIIGICQMRPDELVNLDSVAYLLSETLLQLGVHHNNQKAQLQANPRFKTAIPWKYSGYRLSEAMKQWKANVEKLPVSRSPDVVLKLIDAASLRFLTKLEQDGINAVPDAQPIANWRNANKPKVARVFSDDPMSGFQVQ